MKQSDLTSVKRTVPFPYPVKILGYTSGESYPEARNFYFADRLEVCLRISSADEYADDRIDEKEYRTKFPHVFLKPPFSRISYRCLSPRNALHFSYSLETVEKLRKDGILPNDFFWEIELTPEIMDMVHRLASMLPHSLERGVSDRIDSACFQLLQELIIIKDAPSGIRDAEAEKVMAIASHLKVYFERDIDHVIRDHGMSRRSFFRHWKIHFKETPAEYVCGMKLEEAARRLRETRQTVTEITQAIGFADSAYLAKIFRKQYGMTPLQYRESFRRKLFS